MKLESLALDTPVTRMTHPAPEGPSYEARQVNELAVGELFIHEHKIYQLVTRRTRFDCCNTGNRVRYAGLWWIVLCHGRENILFPLKPHDDMWSTEFGKNHGTFPFPTEKIDLLTSEEVPLAISA